MSVSKHLADPAVKAWLDRLRADTRQPALQPRRALLVSGQETGSLEDCLLYTSPSPRDS